MFELCLTMLCPPALEEKLLDLLLIAPEAAVFTSTPTSEHGLSFGRLSPIEQVLGRSLATQIQVLLTATDKQIVLDAVQQQFSGAGLRFWVTPIIESGELT